MNHRISRNHPHIWQFIKFMQTGEKQFQRIVLQWSVGASKKQNLERPQHRNVLIHSTNDTMMASSIQPIFSSACHLSWGTKNSYKLVQNQLNQLLSTF